MKKRMIISCNFVYIYIKTILLIHFIVIVYDILSIKIERLKLNIIRTINPQKCFLLNLIA